MMRKSLLRGVLASLCLSGMTAPLKGKEIDQVVDRHDDWLSTEGSRIIDKDGRVVWLTGLNWFGFNTGTNALDGLWSVNLETSLQAIANHGFNVLRIPISTELLHQWQNGIYPRPNINEYVNPAMRGFNSLQVFDRLVTSSKEVGLKIILDVHSAKTNAMGHFHPLWFDGDITQEIYFSAWEWVAGRYRHDDTIIGFDLKNEPHGKPHEGLAQAAIWDHSTLPNNWQWVAQELGRRLHAVHPDALILVEGIEASPKAGESYGTQDQTKYHFNWWGGNLRGVRDYPIDLGSGQNKLVYSPHDYGPTVFRQPWFNKDFNKDTLYQDVWHDNWAFIAEEEVAPLLIGEWGGFMDGGENERWMSALRDFIAEKQIHHTFWCFNPNSGDTGGMVLHDFQTWDEKKYQFVLKTLWRDASGKFVGLDHLKPLGSHQTGTSVGAK